MDAMITRARHLLGAGALLALLVVPVALAATGSDSGSPQANASGVKNKVKKLTAQVQQLQQRVDELEKQPGPQGPEGAQGPQGPEGAQGPPGPSTGTAGGDLTGTYPNPSIASNAVNSAKVADESLTRDDVADGSLTGNDIQGDSIFGAQIADLSLSGADLQNGAVTSGKLGTITRRASNVTVPGGAAENGAYFTDEQTVSCQPGELALTGEAFWAGADDEELFISEFLFPHTGADRPVGLRVTGGNDSGTDRQLNIAVYCLAP